MAVFLLEALVELKQKVVVVGEVEVQQGRLWLAPLILVEEEEEHNQM